MDNSGAYGWPDRVHNEHLSCGPLVSAPADILSSCWIRMAT